MAPSDPSNVPTLRDLIQRHMDRHNQTQRALGVGSGVRHQTLSKWASGTISEFPEPDRLRKFADYTGYSLQTVVLAAARTLGLRVAEVGGQLVNSLPPGTDTLEPEDVDAVRAVVRQLVDARRGSAGGQVMDLSPRNLSEFSGHGIAARQGDSEGVRLAEQQDRDAEHPENP